LRLKKFTLISQSLVRSNYVVKIEKEKRKASIKSIKMIQRWWRRTKSKIFFSFSFSFSSSSFQINEINNLDSFILEQIELKKKAVILIQRTIRMHQCRQNYLQMKKDLMKEKSRLLNSSSIRIQTLYRQHICSTQYASICLSVLTIQNFYRMVFFFFFSIFFFSF